MTESEATRAGVSSLANRPNDASRYGDGGLTPEQLKAKFDNLPRLVKDRFNEVAAMLASVDAPKYITIGKEDNAIGECLYDFLLLFGERGDGISDKNISDYIKVRYQMQYESASRSIALSEVIADLQARIVDLEARVGKQVNG